MSIDKKITIYIISIFIIVMILSFYAGRTVRDNKIDDSKLRELLATIALLEIENKYWRELTDQYSNWLYNCEDELNELIEMGDVLFLKILDCESELDPTACNEKYGCGSGIGLGQLTAVAMKDCERGLEKTIDPYSPADNLECSLWLYKTYGTAPWGCKDCDWGSWDCWSKVELDNN